MATKDFVVKNGLIVTDNAVVNGTGSIKIAAGTTAERPAGVAGDLRFNTDNNIFEGYNGTVWTDFRGYTGSQGTIGPQGATGYTGSQGYTGSKGFTGSAGAGFTGSGGTTGFTGSLGYAGSQGIAGFTGSRGVIGFTGSRGVVGFTGSQGFRASTSDIAPTGIADGHMWFNTNTATLNVYYDDGDSQQWITTSGPAGPLGYTGSQGIQGVIGYTGSAGTGGSNTLTPEEIIAYSTVLGGW